MHTRAAIGLDAILNDFREREGQGQAPDIQQGQSSATTQACPGCKNVCACTCQPCGQCKKILRPSAMRRVDGILHYKQCEKLCMSTTPSGNAHTPTTRPIGREFVLFRTLNFDGDTIMQNEDAGDNQITRLQHQLDEVNTSLHMARKALRNIKRKIEEIDSVVDLEDKSRQLRQYVQSGLAQFGTRKKRPYSQDQDDHHKQDSYFERVIHSVLNGWDVIKPRVREKTILDMIESHSDMCRIDKTALGDDCAVLIKCLGARRCFRFHDVPDLVKMVCDLGVQAPQALSRKGGFRFMSQCIAGLHKLLHLKDARGMNGMLGIPFLRNFKCNSVNLLG